jgi:hypothetical protein
MPFNIKMGYSDAPATIFHNIPHHVTMVKQFMNVVKNVTGAGMKTALARFTFNIPL